MMIACGDGDHAVTPPHDPNAAQIGQPDQLAFRDIQWQLDTFEADGQGVTIPENGKVTLQINAVGKVSGTAAVNQYSGEVIIDDEGTCQWLNGFATTKMAGPAELMELEQAYLNSLDDTTQLRLSHDGETLTLSDDTESVRMTFTNPEDSANEDDPAGNTDTP